MASNYENNIIDAIEQIVNNINSEVRKPPENKGMNVPNIACNP